MPSTNSTVRCACARPACEVVTAEARLPVDLSLTAVTLEQRLLAAPVALRVRLHQLDLGAWLRWQPTLPRLTGISRVRSTCKGRMRRSTSRPMCGCSKGVSRAASSTSVRPYACKRRWHCSLPVRSAVLRCPTSRRRCYAYRPCVAQLPGPGQPPRLFQVHDLVLQAAGRWTAAGFDATLERLQTQVRLSGWPRAEVLVAGRLTPQRLDLARLQVRLPQSEIRGSGSLALPHQRVQLRLDIPRLRLDEVGCPLPASLPPLVRGTIEVQGSVPAPQIEARLQYAGGQVTTTLAAHLQEPTPRYSATLRLDDVHVAQLLAGEQGTLRARLQVQGTGIAESQRRAEVDLHLETSGLTIMSGLMTRLRASLTGNTVRFEHVQVQSVPVVLAASGTASTTHKTHLTYEVTLGDLTPLQRLLGLPLQARGGLSGTLQGTWPALEARSRLQLREWRYGSWHGQRTRAELAVTHCPLRPRRPSERKSWTSRAPPSPGVR